MITAYRTYTFILIAMILSMGALFAQAEHVIDDSKNPQYLFSIASMSGVIEGDTFTLKGVPLVVYFSDRPVRVSGHITLEDFVALWDKGEDNFKANPPNAELAIYNENGDRHAVLIISSPEVSGDAISFKVKVIGEKVPESFGHSTLFIDFWGSGWSFPPT